MTVTAILNRTIEELYERHGVTNPDAHLAPEVVEGKTWRIRERVALGAMFLDTYIPGWWKEELEEGDPQEINIDLLDLGSSRWCVVGQLAHNTGQNYGTLLDDLGVQSGEQLFGFAATMSAGAPVALEWEYVLLTREWYRVISGRRMRYLARTVGSKSQITQEQALQFEEMTSGDNGYILLNTTLNGQSATTICSLETDGVEYTMTPLYVEVTPDIEGLLKSPDGEPLPLK